MFSTQESVPAEALTGVIVSPPEGDAGLDGPIDPLLVVQDMLKSPAVGTLVADLHRTAAMMRNPRLGVECNAGVRYVAAAACFLGKLQTTLVEAVTPPLDQTISSGTGSNGLSAGQ